MGRDSKDFIAFANDLLSKADVTPTIHELINQNVYATECEKQGQRICIVTFVPNIYDSNAAERKAYLKVVEKVAKKHRSSPLDFFWLQAGDQLDLERNLNLGFGFPAVVAIAPSKKKLAVMKAAFNEDNFSEFLTGLMIGKESLEDLLKPIEIKKRDKWDGKDAPPLEAIEEVRLYYHHVRQFPRTSESGQPPSRTPHLLNGFRRSSSPPCSASRCARMKQAASSQSSGCPAQ